MCFWPKAPGVNVLTNNGTKFEDFFHWLQDEWSYCQTLEDFPDYFTKQSFLDTAADEDLF